MKKVTLFLMLVFVCSGCTTVPPWERGRLAKEQMQWEPNNMQASFKRHLYYSKEAASGGDSTAGGGCGCN